MISTTLNKKIVYRLAAFFAVCALLFTTCKMSSDDDEDSGTVPGAPTGITATTVSTTSILVEWESVTGANGYYVYKSDSESGTYTLSNTISTSATLKATVTELAAGTTYYFKVSAYNSYGEGTKSSAVTGTTVASSTSVPDAPTLSTANATSSSAITLTWTTVSTSNGYYIYSSTDDSTFSRTETAAGNSTTSASVTGLTAATTYYFYVTAYNDAGESSASGTVSETTSDSSTRDISDTSSDEVANNTFTNNVYLNLSDMKYSADGSTYTSIPTDTAATIADSITILLASSTGHIDIDASNSTATTMFSITGTASSASISIAGNKKYAVEIYLNGATITSSGNYPCIEVTSKSNTFLVLNGTNSLTDGRTYGYGYGSDYASTSAHYVEAGEDTKGSVYTKGALLISGDGTLSVTTAYKHSIYSKDYIRMFDGTITIANSGRNGIQSVNGFIMEDGEITINGTGTNTNNQSRGIIVEGEEDDDYAGEGYILINGGKITTNTVSKGMSSKWDIDEDADTTDTTDDPNPFVKITGGTISVTTTGSPADESTGTSTFTDADGVSTTETTKLSPEGIEGKQAVYITGGSITVNTTDDGINASHDEDAEFVISGGELFVYSSDNDAIDSNGTLTISGGTIVALTKTTPECAFDCDTNTFTITGGTFVGIGTSNYSAPTTSACTQNAIVLGSSYYTAGSTMALKSSGGTTSFAFDIPSGYGSSGMIMILSSPNIVSNTTYSVYNGATVSGQTDKFNGLYLGSSLSASGGTAQSSTLTTSSTVTTLSTSSNNGAQEGPGGR